MATSLYVIQITLFIYSGITKDLHHKERVITAILESRMDGHLSFHSILATRTSYWLPSYVLSYVHCLQYPSQLLPLLQLPSNRIFPFNSIRTTTIIITTIVLFPYLSSINSLLRSMWWGIIEGFQNQLNHSFSARNNDNSISPQGESSSERRKESKGHLSASHSCCCKVSIPIAIQ